jgi:hypothetical protein
MQTDGDYALLVMQQRIEDMFKLLSLWQQYVDIIYAPDNEMHVLQYMKESGKLGSSLDESGFMNKMETENIDKKIANLFAKTQEELDEQL